MSDDAFFAPPPFKPDEALVQLKRTLRELKLTERGDAFEWRGRPVVRLEVAPDHLSARLVKRPLRSPEWEASSLRSSAEVRRFTDTVKQRLARWDDGDDC